MEIERRVWDEGVCLVWATTAGDCVAFYRSEADLPKIPPAFVPYSDAELLHTNRHVAGTQVKGSEGIQPTCGFP